MNRACDSRSTKARIRRCGLELLARNLPQHANRVVRRRPATACSQACERPCGLRDSSSTKGRLRVLEDGSEPPEATEDSNSDPCGQRSYHLSVAMRVCRLLLLATLGLSNPMNVLAQEPPPRIGPLVIDVRGTVPRFDQTDQLARESRAVSWRIASHRAWTRCRRTFLCVQVEGRYVRTRRTGHARPRSRLARGSMPGLRPVTERFASITPQLSLNFRIRQRLELFERRHRRREVGKIVPDGADEGPADQERLRDGQLLAAEPDG